MKANEAPKKIWVHELSAKEMNVPLKEYHVEYIRADAFIEKAWNWIEDNMLSSNQQDKSRFYYEQFINYMKGE